MGFMKSFTLLSSLAASAAALDPASLSVILPTAQPTITDNWYCALSAYSPYIDPPKPTGTLLSALQSYGSKLQESCTEKRCPYPDATRWCGFTTAAPTTALPAYTSYASSASVWWANHSSSALDLAQECPYYWYDALTEIPSTPGWLNMTIINAECLAGVPAAGSSSRVGSASATFLTLSSLATTSAKPSSRASASSSVATSSPATRKISTDGTCGGTQGYTCEDSAFGDCCSAYGWCGTSQGHCGAGCLFNFGLCNMPSKISPDGTCGTVQNNNGWICPGSGFGNCCSTYGWCGNAADHCDGGCQTAYGTCNAATNALTAREAPTSPIESAATRVIPIMTMLAATRKL